MRSRRTFLKVLGASLLVPVHGLAQNALPRVAWLSPVPSAEGATFFDALRQGLREAGYVEGRTLVVEPYWGNNTAARTEELIRTAIASSPAVLIAQGSVGPLMPRHTSTIPVVFGYSGNPVEAGMIQSFPRPGRNMTGISYMALELVGKRIELLKEVLPAVKRIACVNSPAHPGDQSERRATEEAATKLGVAVEYFELTGTRTLADVLPAIERARVQAVILFPTQTVIANRERIAAWASKTGLPAISGWAQFADGGNFLSYGPNLSETSRRLAFFVDRILKGAKPAELPVELPNEVELVVNQRAAKALKIAVPKSVLVRANRVIT